MVVGGSVAKHDNGTERAMAYPTARDAEHGENNTLERT